MLRNLDLEKYLIDIGVTADLLSNLIAGRIGCILQFTHNIYIPDVIQSFEEDFSKFSNSDTLICLPASKADHSVVIMVGLSPSEIRQLVKLKSFL